MQEKRQESTLRMIHEPGDGPVNMETIGHLPEVQASDSPKIRAYIDNYARVMIAAQFIIDKRDQQLRQDKHFVIAVKNTNNLLMDGRMAADITYSTGMNGGSYREHTLVPLKSIEEIVTRIEGGEIPVLGNELTTDKPAGTL